jgi:dienelactone hydrolase
VLRILATGALMLVLCSGAHAVASKPPVLAERCVPKPERMRAVAFRTADAVSIRGVLLGRGPDAVVLGHQSGGSLCDWLPFARILARNGYRALALDFRGYPSSGKGRGLAASAYDRDFVAAARFLRERGARRLVLMGASMGGTAALVTGSRLKDVAAVASFSGAAEYGGLDARRAVTRLSAPTLLLAGEYDSYFPDDARALYDASIAPKKQLAIRNSRAHGSRLLEGADGRATRDLVLAFLRSLDAR